jgi:hypothetical protein
MIAVIFKFLATLGALATTVFLTVEAAKAGFIVFGTILGLIKAIIVLVFIGLLVLIAVLLIAPWISRQSKSGAQDI